MPVYLLRWNGALSFNLTKPIEMRWQHPSLKRVFLRIISSFLFDRTETSLILMKNLYCSHIDIISVQTINYTIKGMLELPVIHVRFSTTNGNLSTLEISARFATQLQKNH